MRFLLGTHRPWWLRETTAPLFVSDRTLRDYKRHLPASRGPWALDSGGFTELQKFGRWTVSPAEYANRVRRYRDHVGNLLWAAPQDRMCEPIIINGGVVNGQRFVGTRRYLDSYGVLSDDEIIEEHLRQTVTNGIELRTIAPDLPWIYVVQGWQKRHYEYCLHLYAEAGIDLAKEPVVGIGSVCRREATTEAAEIITAVREAVPGIKLHGFGIKTSGMRRYGRLLYSSDSMAWSFNARRKSIRLPGCDHVAKNCAGCARYAFRWRHRVLASLAGHLTRSHTPRTPARTGGKVSRKVDSPAAQRLALSAFRDAAADLERAATIRWAHHSEGLSIRQIAPLVGLSPARVGQLLATDDPSTDLFAQLRDLREAWCVDTDPASRAAADALCAEAIATAAELDVTAAERLTDPDDDGQDDLLEPAA